MFTTSVETASTDPSLRFRVAIVQDSPVFLNLEQSLEKACRLIQSAADQGAKLIAFPETWLPGYPVWLDFAPSAALWDHSPAKAVFALLYENSLTLRGDEVARLASKAVECDCTVVMGVHERLGGTIYNTMLYLGVSKVAPEAARLQAGNLSAKATPRIPLESLPQDSPFINSPPQEIPGLLGHHRKLMPTFSERMIWGQGDGSTLTVIDSPVGRVGGLICWEHWMPLARAAMHAKQELVHVAQWPTCKEMNLVASRHYAFEGQCFVLAAASVLTREEMLRDISTLGHRTSTDVVARARQLLEEIPCSADGYVLRGGSAIIAPNGKVLVGPLLEQSAILTTELNPIDCVEGRLYLDVSGHYSRPDVFRLEVNRNSLVADIA